MSTELKIGLIGLDTSHVPAFTKLLNDPTVEYHVPGAKVVYAYPGGSPDFALSADRVDKFTAQIRDEYGVEILDSPEAVAEKSDGVFITAVDGRVHPGYFDRVASFGKPVFIDKPFAVNSADARHMIKVANERGISLFSASSLRYAQPFVEALAAGPGPIHGIDATGPMNIEPTQGGFYWYGIHTVELVYTALGAGCKRVTTFTSDKYDVVVGEWADGRIGTVRGNRTGNNSFLTNIHYEKGSVFVDAYKHTKPGYAGLLERIIPMFQGGDLPIPLDETLELIRFIEAANESRETGKAVEL